MKQIYKSEAGRAEILGQYAAFLSFWPSPFTHHVVSTEFGDTFVIESGNPADTPVVLLHGSASNAAMWLADAAVLGQMHRVFAVDIIGEPGKSAETRPRMSSGCYARWLRQVLDELSINKTAIAGNSMGGWIALDFAIKSPERVSALVLLATSGLYPFRRTFALKMLKSRLFPSSSNLNQSVTGSAAIPEGVLKYLDLIHREFIPRPLHAPAFSRNELKRLNMPLLYIGGENDKLLNTQRSAARLKRFVSQADARILPATAHTIINMGSDINAFLSSKEV